jgi:hypothetical protein
MLIGQNSRGRGASVVCGAMEPPRVAPDAIGRFQFLVTGIAGAHADRLGIAARFGERVAGQGGRALAVKAAPVLERISEAIDDQRQALLSGAFGMAVRDAARIDRAVADLDRAFHAAGRLYSDLASIECRFLN